MAADQFLKIDGIPGESTDEKHKGWIEILTFTHGVIQPATAASSGGARSAERATLNDLTCAKNLDKATPKLFQYCCNGKHIKEVKIEACRATGDKQKYLEIVMSDVIVSSFSIGSGSDLPMDQISFNYGKIEYIYTDLDHQTGKPKGDVKAGWDLVGNKGF